MGKRIQWACIVACLSGSWVGLAHQGILPSVHTTVAKVIERMKSNPDHDGMVKLTASQAVNVLSKDEKGILSTQHIRFKVDRESVVYVVVPNSEIPFWLQEEGFESWKSINDSTRVFRKTFPAGEIGLGVNALASSSLHYFVVVKATQADGQTLVSDLYPGPLRAVPWKLDGKFWVDHSITVDPKKFEIPCEFEGALLIQTQHSQRNDSKLTDLFRKTDYPSKVSADQIVLTWSQDPKTSQTIQWRTHPSVSRGMISYLKKSDHQQFFPKQPLLAQAATVPLATDNILNDPVVHRHTVTLTDLEPGTTYLYSVGDGTTEGWSPLAEFTTAPDKVEPFSFIYMGDAQNGLDRWGTLVHNAYRERPDATFYLMAGDLVNRGNDRDDWDSFFYNAKGIFNNRPIVPVLGNHEYHGGKEPWVYLNTFTLLENGPKSIGPEKAYSFEYSNAIFIILDSNLAPETQTVWLENQLKQTKATWKFVSYHHPAYSSAPNRDNVNIRKHWLPLFDQYHVDLALQGHDHAYLRTYPMKEEKKVEKPKDGTVYIVSVSGTKTYDQDPRNYTEFGMTKVATYQVIDLQISGDRMVYRAYDIDGTVRDTLIIDK